jgi:hypothetical protein
LQECHDSVNHSHPLRLIRAGADHKATNPASSPEERERRQRVMEGHVRLLEHACYCQEESCSTQSCDKMKLLVNHFRTCKESKTACQWCKRILLLVRLHAQRCTTERCQVAACSLLQERIRMLQQQQQLMDDRRRQAANAAHQDSDDQASVAEPLAQAEV